jgi:hypothetical protein
LREVKDRKLLALEGIDEEVWGLKQISSEVTGFSMICVSGDT